MSPESSTSLLNIFYNIDLVLLIFGRILGGIFLIPIFSNNNLSNQVKIGFSFIISVLIFSTGTLPIVEYNNLMQFLFIFIKEFLTGTILGFVVYLYFSIFYFAGQLLDYQIGFSMVSIFDPMTNIQVPITGNMLYFVMVAFFVQSDGMNAFLYSLINSYDIMPMDTLNLVNNESLTVFFVDLVSSFFYIGVTIAMPFIGTIILVDFALGLLVKAVPQMNVFVVGMPLKLLIGLIMLFALIPFFGMIYENIYYDMMNSIQSVLYDMQY